MNKLFILFVLIAYPVHADWTIISNSKTDVLESTLKDLDSIFPAKILPVIQRVPIEVDNSKVNITGVYEGRWQVIKGKLQPIGVGKIRLYSSKDFNNKILLIHELSHAAQSLTIGIDNPRVRKAYQEVVKKNLYAKNSYLLTNHKEYFAEMSVVYLHKLHYFPYDRETLKKHDPISYDLMEDFWGLK